MVTFTSETGPGATAPDDTNNSVNTAPKSILRPSIKTNPSSSDAVLQDRGDSFDLNGCLELVSDEPDYALEILKDGLRRSEDGRSRALRWLNEQSSASTSTSTSSPQPDFSLLSVYFSRSPSEKALCLSKGKLESRIALVKTWQEMERSWMKQQEEEEFEDPWADNESDGSSSLEIDGENSNSPSKLDRKKETGRKSSSAELQTIPISLSKFLTLPLPTISLLLASTTTTSPPSPSNPSNLPLLQILSADNFSSLYPCRWKILDAIPMTISTTDIVGDLIPLRQLNGRERWVGKQWEDESVKDIDENDMDVGQVVDPWKAFQDESNENSVGDDEKQMEVDGDGGSGLEGSVWFLDRIQQLEDLGLPDLALDWATMGIQRGWGIVTTPSTSTSNTDTPASSSATDASNIPSLESSPLQEKHELLRFLVPLSYRPNSVSVKWNGHLLRHVDERVLVEGYMWSCKEGNGGEVARAVKDWVVPFLEWREKQAGQGIQEGQGRGGDGRGQGMNETLFAYILDLPLGKALEIFEQSKATLPISERIIKSDVDVVRMALAILYGSDSNPKNNSLSSSSSKDQWKVMSRIFECMPMWDVSTTDEIEDKEVTNTTLESLAAFMSVPSTEKPPGPQELLLFFQVLKFGSLSKALDIMDIHLECGEILAKWNVPAPLRTFLVTAFDKQEQMDWALRMSRSAGMGGVDSGRAKGKEKEEERYWMELLDDMTKLNKREEGAFGRLSEGELVEVFLDGLLSSGNFQFARSLLHPPDNKRPTLPSPPSPASLERIALRVAGEMFDNAETGVLDGRGREDGLGGVADCLSVALQTSAITTHLNYIRAVSTLLTSYPKVSAFPVTKATSSKQLESMTPLQVRMTSNKLDLVRSAISNAPGVYRTRSRSGWMELAEGLSFEVTWGNSLSDDEAGKGKEATKVIPSGPTGRIHREIELLGMIVEGAIGSSDWIVASETAAEMEDRLRAVSRQVSSTKESIRIANERAKTTCWTTFFSLGSQQDYTDISIRLHFLGHALRICPVSEISEILVVWKKLEDGRIRLEDARRHRKVNRLPEPEGSVDGSAKGNKRHRRNGSTSSIKSDSSTGSATVSAGRGEERFLGSRTAARAAKALNAGIEMGASQAASRGFSLRPLASAGSSILRPGSSQSDRSGTGSAMGNAGAQTGSSVGEGDIDLEEIRAQARKALHRGVGWLLGSDES